MSSNQLSFPFEIRPEIRPSALFSPDELYEKASQELLQEVGEDRRIERKPVGIHARELAKYFSMWANTAPEGGLLVIGLEDDGTPAGCSTASQNHINELEKSGHVYCPDAKHEIKRIEIERPDGGKDFLMLIRVSYHEDKVVITTSGEAYARSGDSKIRLGPEAIHELRINKREIDWEQEPSIFNYRTENESAGDFDHKLARHFVEKVRQSRGLSEDLVAVEILELRRLGRIVQGEFKPNRACSLLFARDPVREFPGCKIRFMRFDGEREQTGEKFNAVKDISLEGPIPLLIQEAQKIVALQLREFSRLGPDGRFYTAKEYPEAAWQEAIVNACVHRSYGLKTMMIFVKMFDDRLVVESPGGFPPLVTPKNIFDMHAPRNPFLMDALFYMDFVKCAHEGTRRMRDSMKAMDLPLPEFRQLELEHPLVRVTLRNNVKQRKVWVDSDVSAILGESIFQDLTEPERRAVNFVAEHGSITVSQLGRLVGKAWQTNKKILDGLVARSILKHIKRSDLDRDPNARYELKNGR